MTKRNSELNLAFSTPIWTSIIPNFQELNAKLYKYIKNLYSNNPDGITKSNLMGWHSEDFDLDSHEPKYFINSISSCLNDSSLYNSNSRPPIHVLIRLD